MELTHYRVPSVAGDLNVATNAWGCVITCDDWEQIRSGVAKSGETHHGAVSHFFDAKFGRLFVNSAFLRAATKL